MHLFVGWFEGKDNLDLSGDPIFMHKVSGLLP